MGEVVPINFWVHTLEVKGQKVKVKCSELYYFPYISAMPGGIFLKLGVYMNYQIKIPQREFWVMRSKVKGQRSSENVKISLFSPYLTDISRYLHGT